MTKKYLFLVMLIFVGLILAFLKLYGINTTQAIPDTADARQIQIVMNSAYQIIGDASRTFDASEFPSVFIDTEDYKLTDEQQENVAKALGIDSSEVKNTGYLTAMQTSYLLRAQGASLLQAALDKARLENRELTAEEFQEVVKANHGQVPSMPLSAKDLTKNEKVLTFESIRINGDRAIVKYDDGAALQEAILVKINGGWFIASIVPIKIHF